MAVSVLGPLTGAARAVPPRSARNVVAVLRVVYGGFDTPDLKEAKTLLEELAARYSVLILDLR